MPHVSLTRVLKFKSVVNQMCEWLIRHDSVIEWAFDRAIIVALLSII